MKSKYHWGRSRQLLNIEPGASIDVTLEDENDYSNWRRVAFSLGYCGAHYTFHRQSPETVTITRKS